MSRLASREEAFVRGIVGDEALHEAVIDLIGRAADAGADRRDDIAAPRAEAFHCVERRVGDPGDRAFPPGMRRRDDPHRAIGKQHRDAIGGEDAEQYARRARRQRVGFGPGGKVAVRIDDVAAIAMHLIKPRQRGARQHGGADAAAIFRNQRGIVARSHAAVERGKLAGRHAAAPSEKSVRDPGERRGGGERWGHRSSLQIRSSSIWLPTRNALRPTSTKP